jgi:hypothetical protein
MKRFVFAIILACASPALASNLETRQSPTIPIVINADIETDQGVIQAPWFLMSLTFKNSLEVPVTIFGFSVKITSAEGVVGSEVILLKQEREVAPGSTMDFGYDYIGGLPKSGSLTYKVTVTPMGWLGSNNSSIDYLEGAISFEAL